VVGVVTVTGNNGGVKLNGSGVLGALRGTGNTGTLPAPDIGPVHANTGRMNVQP